MSLFKRNIMVGLTALVALLLLGWMILRFSNAPMQLFAAKQIPISFQAASAEGISEGSPITYLGVSVGRVSRVARQRIKLATGQERDAVVIEALLDDGPPLPANVEGRIRTQLIGGGASIRLELVPTDEEMSKRRAMASTHPSASPPPIQEVGVLQPHAQLRAVFVGNELVPPEFSDLATGINRTAEELRLLLHDIRDQNVVPELVSTIRVIRTDAETAGDALKHIRDLVGNKKIHDDLELTIANLRTTSESATRIGENLERLSKNANTRLDELSNNGNKMLVTTQTRVDQVGKQLGDRLTQLAAVLDQFEKASKKLNDGNGTAAQLLNNPAMYENLLDTSRELKLTIADFRRLVEQWEQEGVSFKLK